MRRLSFVRPVVGFGVLASIGLATVRSAAADFDHDAYTSPVAPGDLLWVERAAPAADSAPSVKPFGRLTVSFADDPLVLANPDGSDEAALIDSETSVYLSGGAVLWRRLQVALIAPIHWRHAGGAGTPYDVGGAAFGDPGLDLRLTLLTRSSPVELALGSTIKAPLGTADVLASDGQLSVWPRVILSTVLGPHVLLSFGTGPWLRKSTSERSLEVSDSWRFVGGASIGLTESWALTVEAAGATALSDPFAAGRSPFEVSGGLRFERARWVGSVGAGPGLSNGFGTPDFRVLGSIGVTLGDESPKLGSLDTDHDGLTDANDQCPTQAEDRDGFEDGDGCPDPDNDRDGIVDAIDHCPIQAEDRDGFEDQDGCPDPDDDGDGLLDELDRCPREAEDRDGWRDDDGCPDPDNDGDGLADADDRCPNEAETINGIDDEDGCPDLLRVEAGQITTLEPIYFEYNRAKIQKRSEPLLIELATLLVARSDLGRISIEGHTDSKGPDDYNLTLSDERARAVMTFLVDAGVPPERLESHGYGETRPLDDNATDSGRARNRRVEFHLVDMAEPSSSH